MILLELNWSNKIRGSWYNSFFDNTVKDYRLSVIWYQQKSRQGIATKIWKTAIKSHRKIKIGIFYTDFEENKKAIL